MDQTYSIRHCFQVKALFKFRQIGRWRCTKSRTGLYFPLFSPVYLHHFNLSTSCFRKVQDQRACGNHWWDIKVRASWSTRAQRGNKRQTKQNVLANFWMSVYWFQMNASTQISRYSKFPSPPDTLLTSCTTSAFSSLTPQSWILIGWFILCCGCSS